MEDVAIMVPPTITNDELSDETESINLDLHVSDTEDSTESLKKGETGGHAQTESEEDILNKYIDDNASTDLKELKTSENDKLKATLPNGAKNIENYEKCNGVKSPLLDEIDDEDMEKTSDDVEMKEKEEIEKANVEDEKANVEDEKEEKVVDANEEKVEDANEKNVEDEKESAENEKEEIAENEKEESAEKEFKEEIAQEGKESPKISTNDEEALLKEDEDEEMIKDLPIDDQNSEETEAKEDEVLNNESKETDSDLTKCENSKQTDSDKTIVDNSVSDKIDDSVVIKDIIEDNSKETENSNSSSTPSDKNETATTSSSSPSNEETDVPKPTDESKTEELEDNDDLLCVMDEKTVEEANENNKDENSCSASEKDDETKETENEDESKETENEEDTKEDQQENEETCDETKEDEEMLEETNESQMELDLDATECAMDIEESDIGGVVYTSPNRDLTINLPDKDANKENEHESDSSTSANKTSVDINKTVVKENGVSGLTNGDVDEADKNTKEDDAVIVAGIDEETENETLKKSSKRQLSDSSTDGDSAKKIKLQTEEPEKPPPEKRNVYFLGSFKKYMLDKRLKKLTRFELEELCMQKMCECIVNKSEIGELKQKVLLQEQTIDSWRKEAIVVAKQTRDLKIVHERLMTDLKVMKEQSGKPLVPVKITRSVGLQAIIENPTRVRSVATVNGPSTLPQQRTPIINNQNKTVSSPQNRQQINKPKVTPQRTQNNNARPLQPITQKDNVNTPKPRQQIVASPQQKKNADPKAVIDLTDEDEKNQNAKTTTPKTSTNTASPTVRILNKQNTNTVNSKQVVTTPNSQPSKIMFVSQNVLPRNSVMVKMNSNGLVNPPNGLTTIPNGQVSVVTTPVVRTVSQVRVPVTSVTTVRAATPQTKIFKHPAPLPAAPSYQTNIPGKKPIPPKPHLNLTRSSCGTGIVLQWKMPYKLDSYETIVSYQLYAYQETKSPPKTDNWGKIGDVKALELPMAVTLTQFAVGNRYFFAVRAVDGQKRLGPFSEPENILL